MSCPGSTSRWFTVAFCVAFLSCTEVRDDEDAEPASGCIGCHGDENGHAPTDALHQTHLSASDNFLGVTCESCHVVPEVATAPGHADDPEPAEVTFSGAAIAAKGNPPTWNAETKTCASVGCHGEGLRGGDVKSPIWDETVEKQAECGSCHGNPPGDGHPNNEECKLCHVVDDPARHGDGVLDTILPESCSACHGDEKSDAPLDAVHRIHVLGSGNSKPVACSACHVVPKATTDEGHLDDSPAEVTFGGLALLNSEPEYVDGKCTNSYCHAGRPGGAVTSPSWTDDTGAASACNGCHGVPMPQHHPQVEACALCHGDVGSDTEIFDAAKHVNGEVDLKLPKECGACHGKDDDPAPLDGAHAKHLGTEIMDLACESCHVVPGNLLDPGHVDDALPVEVTFSDPATAGGATPSWNAPSCAGTACHAGKTVEWKTDMTGPTACDACHGAPPEAPHPVSDRCEVCHDKVAGPELSLKNVLLHINGSVTTNSEPACNGCHGGEDTPAPDLGAHLAHISAGVACGECHQVPTLVTDAGHLDDALPAEVEFGPVATSKNSTPSWDAAAGTCSSAWCHGAGSMGGSVESPSWTDTSGAAKACGACHALPPPAPHPAVSECGLCHKSTVGTDQHPDGTVDFGSD